LLYIGTYIKKTPKKSGELSLIADPSFFSPSGTYATSATSWQGGCYTELPSQKRPLSCCLGADKGGKTKQQGSSVPSALTPAGFVVGMAAKENYEGSSWQSWQSHYESPRADMGKAAQGQRSLPIQTVL